MKGGRNDGGKRGDGFEYKDDGLVGLRELPGFFTDLFMNFIHGLKDIFLGNDFGGRNFSWRIIVQVRTYSVALAFFIIWSVSSLLVQKLDPFGMMKALDSYSSELVERLAAPFYGSAAQDEIAVVLINERTLESRQTSWPPRYTYYEEVVRRVLASQPKAVFVDVILKDHRAYDDTLPTAVAALREDIQELGDAAPPILFAKMDAAGSSLFREAGVSEVLTAWANTSGAYPLVVTPGISYGANSALVNAEKKQEPPPCQNGLNPETAAMALYRIACDGNNPACAESASLMSGDALCRPVQVQWGRMVSPIMQEQSQIEVAGCDMNVSEGAGRFWSFLRITALALVQALDDDAQEEGRQRCPYTVTVMEDNLGTEEADRLLKNRIVLIGTNLDGIHDLVKSPVHGMIPGVYLHAMALDNLMTWGRGHYSTSKNELPILIALGALTALSVSILLRSLPRRVRLWLHFLAIFMVLVPSLVLYFVFRQPPLDWLGLFILVELILHLPHWKSQDRGGVVELSEGGKG